MYKSNTKYTNRYGDKYWWEKLEDTMYQFHMPDMKWSRGGYDDKGKTVWFDPSGGPFISVGDKVDGKEIVSIGPNMIVEVMQNESST